MVSLQLLVDVVLAEYVEVWPVGGLALAEKTGGMPPVLPAHQRHWEKHIGSCQCIEGWVEFLFQVLAQCDTSSEARAIPQLL